MATVHDGGIDVELVRSETPGIDESAFLLSAGSSLPSRATLGASIEYLEREARIGGYAAADEVDGVLRQARRDLAVLVGGQEGEVALTTSDTVAWIKAWWGWVMGGNVPGGSTVLVDRLSYHSHYAALVQTQQIGGFSIRVAPSLPDGTVDLAELAIDDHIATVCMTMIGTHCGNVNPVAEVGALAAASGAPMFVDGCQALGHLCVDVRSLGCQVFTATGRKYLRAPRGTGMLWVAGEVAGRFSPPGIDGTSTDWSPESGLSVHPGVGRFEEYEVSYAAMVGLANAAAEARSIGIDAIEARVLALADRLRGALAAIPGVVVRDTAERRCGIVTFTVDGTAPDAVVAAARAEGVIVNPSSATWAALDMHAKHLTQVVRASPHYFNTEGEVDRLVAVVGALPRMT